MNWEVLEASSREIMEAYLEALEGGEESRIRFWRSVVVERLVLIHGAVTDYYGAGGADRDESEGR